MMPRNVSLPIYFLFRQLISNSLLILTPQMAAFASFWTTKRGPWLLLAYRHPSFIGRRHRHLSSWKTNPLQISHPSLQTCAGLSGGEGGKTLVGAASLHQSEGWLPRLGLGSPAISCWFQIPLEAAWRDVRLLFRAESPRWTWRARGREPGAESLSQADGQPEGEGRGEGSPGRRAALGSGEGAARGRARSHRRGLQPRGCTWTRREAAHLPRSERTRAGRSGTRASRAALPRSTERPSPAPGAGGPTQFPGVSPAADSASHSRTSSLKVETEGRLWQSSAYTSFSDLEKMSQERGESGGVGGKRTVNSSSRGARAACLRLRAARRRGRPAGIPGLAAHPSGRPAPHPVPAKLTASPRAHYSPQYIISSKVLTMCETPVTPQLLSVISTFIHI